MATQTEAIVHPSNTEHAHEHPEPQQANFLNLWQYIFSQDLHFMTFYQQTETMYCTHTRHTGSPPADRHNS